MDREIEKVRIFQVDAFAKEPFRGNPAAVCLMAEPRPDEWRQNVAREMNVSETAFLLQEEGGYSLRWFTPVCEVSLCGHATLASAHILWEQGLLAPYWGARLGGDSFVAYQASERGGVARCRLEGEDRVILGGEAVTVMEGRLLA